MKKLILILLALTMLATFTACGKNGGASGETETKWLVESETYVYKDSAWGTVTTDFTYDEKGNLLTTSQMAGDEKMEAAYTYDKNGFCTRIEMTQGITTMRYEITNNKNGNRTKTELYNGNLLMQSINYTYDDDGNLLTQENANSSYTMVTKYTYDEQGNMLTATTLVNGTVSSKITLEYDSEGRQIRSVTTDAKGNVTDTVDATFEGNVETQVAKDANGNVTGTTVKTMDEHGNVVAIEVSGTSNDYTYTATFISIEVPASK